LAYFITKICNIWSYFGNFGLWDQSNFESNKHIVFCWDSESLLPVSG